jgi:tRNA(Ile)-lysidine synthase
VAVSGGADSTALALLTQRFLAERSGELLALIVDHGLRAESAAEAALTQKRLAARGIESRVLTLAGLGGGGVQAKARDARYKALAQAARVAGFLHLLLGHHAADQVETVAMRMQRGPGGQEGMAAWAARDDVLILRPLLNFPPADLRTYLQFCKMKWVEDPSNRDERFERARVRRREPGGGMFDIARLAAPVRVARDGAAAEFLAARMTWRPEGYAVVDAVAMPQAALAALLRVVGGHVYPPARDAVAALAAQLKPATLGGVRILPAGRLGAGWLLVREPAACAAPVPAVPGAVWDGRFRMRTAASEGAMLGALGGGAADFQKVSHLPAAVLFGMACLRLADKVIAFPAPALFAPPAPAASHPFFV